MRLGVLELILSIISLSLVFLFCRIIFNFIKSEFTSNASYAEIAQNHNSITVSHEIKSHSNPIQNIVLVQQPENPPQKTQNISTDVPTLILKARNLEIARDFQGAAKLFQEVYT